MLTAISHWRCPSGKGRGLVTTSGALMGDLLVLSPALGFVEGAWGEAPEVEDLQVGAGPQGAGGRASWGSGAGSRGKR